jgi:glycosyltransferase involved in cell wall biosynthesis
MPTISVFTPSHDITYLEEAYVSLLDQDYDDWEWVVLLNGKDLYDYFWSEPFGDERVRVLHTNEVDGVGHAKKLAVEACKGDYLVELDHDDILEPNCLSEVYRIFQDHPEASLVYSSFTQIDGGGAPHTLQFDGSHGWRYEMQDGFLVPQALEPTPHNVSLIWYAPNHVRAFNREAYEKAGGYDPQLDILDDQDLIAKLYRVGGFVSIPKRLYRQRLHGGNTQFNREINARIQSETWDHYEKNILPATKAWCWRNDLIIADDIPLGSAWNPEPNSIGLVRTFDLHKWTSPEAAMNQIHNALAPNGMFMTIVPYWGEAFFQQYITGSDAPFQVSRLRSFWSDGIPYVQANLIAVKPGYTRDGGILDNSQVDW